MCYCYNDDSIPNNKGRVVNKPCKRDICSVLCNVISRADAC